MSLSRIRLDLSHNDSEEHFKSGLPNAFEDAVVQITQFSNRIRPQALQRALITVLFKFSMEVVKIETITSYLHRIRQSKTNSYVDHTVSGLWKFVSNRQFDENYIDWAKYCFTVAPDQVLVDAGKIDARAQTFATTRSLLNNIRHISLSSDVMQVVLDSNHRV
jgi:hypothetical protein